MLSTHIWFIFFLNICRGEIPIVLNTWQFTQATEKVWQLLNQNVVDAVDAVTMGTSVCEELQCDHTVGYGGSPDENGETTLDALIFDGSTIDMGAVAGLRRVKDAARVARHVLKYTSHSFLVGDLATEFAKNLGFKEESLRTNYSLDLYTNWRSQNCQPNFWKNVEPDPRRYCGPYHPTISNEISEVSKFFNSQNHDTIGMIVIDRKGDIVAGTSTNGANHKIPGRVGDSPIPGAGAYADNEVGAAVATGDGDVMMRFLPSFLAVEEMRRGETPTRAARIAIERIAKRYPTYFGAVLAVNSKGVYGAACNGMEEFPFSVADSSQGAVSVKKVKCCRNVEPIAE